MPISRLQNLAMGHQLPLHNPARAPASLHNQLRAPASLQLSSYGQLQGLRTVSYPESKVIRVGGAPDKHVNIIFVKAPSSSSQSQTEVILPEQPQQKTLVYVLVKKPESSNNVRVSGPAPTKPSKPEVFFIRYSRPTAGSDGGYGAPLQASSWASYGPTCKLWRLQLSSNWGLLA
ncbi:hypothetical protein Ocin01_10120 [Orchesella cincta]|uniref:DUF243 domain-containing protein n=1 Tax=Orchesella cincta TaxID=48709 RepID=A0A1D2MUR7_ORCCI|nr:hypothetical protein Ocin01_10120 [Orchesella cincta]